jgi:hypothetical protein
MELGEMRPTFFRFVEQRAFSGWMSSSGDYWATPEVLNEAAELLRAAGYLTLACELALSLPNEHGMCLMKHADPALETGERLMFTKDIDLHPMDFVEAGERCVAVRRCRSSGVVDLFMQGYHRRLDADSNCLILEPHTCDEFLGFIKLMPTEKARPYREREAVAA